MRIYFAGMNSAGFGFNSRHVRELNPYEFEIRKRCWWVLESYHYIGKGRTAGDIRRDGIKIFLDSGAFSSWSIGKVIDLDEYVKFIYDNLDIIDFPSILDAIGDPAKTWDNQVEMERQGIRPIPCFHIGDDESYLKRYLDNYDYLALGGLVGAKESAVATWLDWIWDKYLTKPDGSPRLKVHAFGVTSVPLMDRYPWFSVDSSSWSLINAFGQIYFPEFGTIAFSDRSPARKEPGKHYDTLPPLMQAKVRESIERRGFDLERLLHIYAARRAWNVNIFNEIAAAKPTDQHFKREQQTFF